MIVQMAKVVVMGPRELLLEVLACIEEQGILQIDQESKPRKLKEIEPALQGVVLDRESLGKRFHYEELLQKIDALLAYLPPGDSRAYRVDNGSLARFVVSVIDKHLGTLRTLDQEQKQLAQDQREIEAAQLFLETIAPLFAAKSERPILDYIGVSIRDPRALAELRQHLEQEIGRPVSIDTVAGRQGELLGVITAEQEVADLIRKKLSHNLVVEHELPPGLTGLPVPEKIAVLAGRGAALQTRQRQIKEQVATFSRRWQSVYRHVRGWLLVQLSLLNVTAKVYQTRLCFFIFGWIPQQEVAEFSRKLSAEFSGKVTVEEKEIQEQDLDRVPTALHNPAYFQPFEIFSRLLPVPGYSSFDLTPYIGIFFPLFFGMMLGDLGYGFIVSCLGLLLLFRWWPEKKMARDGGKIMVVCGIYAMVFGLLYGEFFGGLGKDLVGLKPILIDRHGTILPMFYFAMGAGLVHISLALLLGGLSACRRGESREAIFKFVSILFILFLSLLVATAFFSFSALVQRPLLIGIAIIVLLLFLSGGLLAPLEAMKHLGNIISYARIMAIGLTSVLLAYVANHLAGMVGSIWLGIFIGILLHGFNVLLGIFAPAVHALRLHYVEFFSKTMDKKGHEFTPLGKKKSDG